MSREKFLKHICIARLTICPCNPLQLVALLLLNELTVGDQWVWIAIAEAKNVVGRCCF